MPAIGDIPGPGRGSRRYTTRPFPAYRYVPGVHPHPTRDARGHSYQPSPSLNRHQPWRPEDWRTLEDWLYGVDLFNAFYFWEAHEAWEGLWASVERTSVPGVMLQGLIQIAAALLKAHMGTLAGARILSAEGLDKLRRAAAAEPVLMGLHLPAIITSFEEYFKPLGCAELPALADVPVLQLAALE